MRHEVLRRLKVLRAEIETAQRNAAAERALEATGESNPWSGATAKLDGLRKEQRELELQAEGEALVGKLERLRQLDSELVNAQQARTLADEAVRVAAEHEAVQRWMRAGTLARAAGVGYDFESAFSKWFLSGKAKFAGAPACTSYFMQDAPDVRLRFSEADRPHIIKWWRAKGDAQAALVHWDALAQSRALLLRENPELASVA
ncbi:MAG: hypothetical protein WB438_13710 [Candidatus Cybelea sp.]